MAACGRKRRTMSRRLRAALGALAGLLVVVQGFRIDRTNPPVEQDVAAPAGVEALLRRACYNCHSHETVWPWYSHVAPVSWLLAHDVSEGRRELNFSTWAAYPAAKKVRKLRKSADEVAKFSDWLFVGQRHRPVRDHKMRNLELLPHRPNADEPVDVKRTKQEDERVNRTEDRQ